MNKKKLIIAAIALVVVVAALLTVYFLSRPKTQEGMKTITVTVVHGNGESKAFTYTTDKTYVGDLLVEEGLISGTQAEYGLFVETVDGETIADSNAYYWAFYEGDTQPNYGVDTAPLQDGMTYQLVYTQIDLSIFEETVTEESGVVNSHGGGEN